jgi:hypothetical protein
MNSTIPADLLELEVRFETWRANRIVSFLGSGLSFVSTVKPDSRKDTIGQSEQRPDQVQSTFERETPSDFDSRTRFHHTSRPTTQIVLNLLSLRNRQRDLFINRRPIDNQQ